MLSIVDGLSRLRDRISISEKFAFFSAMIEGFITHSFMFYNKISYADERGFYFKLGTTFPSGRWALGLIEKGLNKVGLPPFSSPLINGGGAILILALVALLIVRMMNINKRRYAILIGAYIVVFPTVTSTFSYMFTAPYYLLAALLMALAVYLTSKSYIGTMLGALCISFAMGLYQAYFGVATALFVMKLICEAKANPFKKNVFLAIRYLFSLVLGLGLYLVLNQFFLKVVNTKLTTYQGIGNMTNASIGSLLAGVKNAYIGVLQLTQSDFVGISNSQIMRIMYIVCFGLTGILALMYLIMIYKKYDIWNLLYGVVLFAIAPLSIGIIYVMTAASADVLIHTLMIYSFVFIPIYPIVLLNNIEVEVKKDAMDYLLMWGENITIVVVCIMICFYFRLDNFAYLKAQYQQENAIAYFTTLMTEIKGVDGYIDHIPVAFVGNLGDSIDWSIDSPEEFDEVNIKGFHANTSEFVSYYAGVRFMERHCGFHFEEPENMLEISTSEYVRNMPCYPDDGSVQIVNGVLIVKFSDVYY